MGWIGTALVDVGTPLAPGMSIVDDGSTGTAVTLSGYSIVEAADMAGAQDLTAGHPYLSAGSGEYAIDIFEMMPRPDLEAHRPGCRAERRSGARDAYDLSSKR